MQFKKKDIKRYKFDEIFGKEKDKEELDELVTSTGAPISGDEVSVSNSEIETAPQATTDDFAKVAIQPNRYLYNVGGSSYSRGASVHSESHNKMVSLLNRIFESDIQDTNQNGQNDFNELNKNIINKTDKLLSSLDNNGLTDDGVDFLLKYISDKLKTRNA